MKQTKVQQHFLANALVWLLVVGCWLLVVGCWLVAASWCAFFGRVVTVYCILGHVVVPCLNFFFSVPVQQLLLCPRARFSFFFRLIVFIFFCDVSRGWREEGKGSGWGYSRVLIYIHVCTCTSHLLSRSRHCIFTRIQTLTRDSVFFSFECIYFFAM